MADPRRPQEPALRADAERRLLAGESVSLVAAALAVPQRTVRRWWGEVRPQPATIGHGGRPDAPGRLLRAVPAAPPEASPATGEEHRAELVEAAVGRGWNLAIRRQLSAALDVDVDELDRLRTRALERAAAHLREPAESRLAEFLLRVRWTQATALKAGDLGALTRLLSLEARIQQLDTLQVQVEHSGQVLHALSPDELAARREVVRRRLLAEHDVQ